LGTQPSDSSSSPGDDSNEPATRPDTPLDSSPALAVTGGQVAVPLSGGIAMLLMGLVLCRWASWRADELRW
jgi:hypothetical protein